MSYLMNQVKAKFKIKKKHFKALPWPRGTRIGDRVRLFELNGWRPHHKDNNPALDITDIQFIGERRGGDEDFLKTIAPYVEPGSYIQMAGEDHAQWRWVFNGKTCKEVRGKLTF